MTAEKYCPRCRLFKTVDEFWFNRSSHDGFQSYCIPCTKDYAADREAPVPWKGDTHAKCGGVLSEYEPEIRSGHLAICDKCRLVGIPV